MSGEVEGEIDILAPDTRSKAITGVIGELHGFFRGAEGHRRENRTENFDLGNGGGGGYIGEERWRVETAFALQAFCGPAWLPHGCAFVSALLYQRLDLLQLYRRNDGTDIDGFVEWIADAQFFHSRAKLPDHFFRNTFLHQQTRSSTTHLPLVEPDCIDHTFNGTIEIGVVKNHEGRFATEFQ